MGVRIFLLSAIFVSFILMVRSQDIKSVCKTVETCDNWTPVRVMKPNSKRICDCASFATSLRTPTNQIWLCDDLKLGPCKQQKDCARHRKRCASHKKSAIPSCVQYEEQRCMCCTEQKSK
ncbi:hypothetical protein O0L34_g1620 [Tuta absoluta]|nr:hypothetical protein O0L34_g1620 [Tuta absoluta]